MLKDPILSKSGVSVLESLMARLEKNVPTPGLSPFPIGSSLEERMKALEAENERIRAELRGDPVEPAITLTPVEAPAQEAPPVAQEEVPAAAPNSSEPPLPDRIPPGGIVAPSIQEAAINVLKTIVENFNENLEIWYKTTGCVANFSWDYSDRKKLIIAGVDYIVYRKPAPSGSTIKEILGKGVPAS